MEQLQRRNHSNEAIELYTPVMQFIILYRAVMSLSMKVYPRCDNSTKSYWTYSFVIRFVMLWKAVLLFESVEEILKCDHLNESLLSSTFLW